MHPPFESDVHSICVTLIEKDLKNMETFAFFWLLPVNLKMIAVLFRNEVTLKGTQD